MNLSTQLGRTFLKVMLWMVVVVNLWIFGHALQMHIHYYAMERTPPPFLSQIRNSMANWYPWILYAPLLFVLAKKLPIHVAALKWRSMGLMVAASMAVAMIQIAWITAYGYLVGEISFQQFGVFGGYWLYFTLRFMGTLSICWTVVAFFYAIIYYGQSLEQRRKAEDLQHQLERAQLKALQMQLQPHFLFNTLNSISTLMYRDAKAADLMLTRLARLLRKVLLASEEPTVSLGQELEFVRDYLAIERIRFQDRLTVRFKVEPDLEKALVPAFVLQPLVENAIKHGVGPHARPGIIEIQVARTKESLVLGVWDNGPPTENQTSGTGLGLVNLRARLHQLYGADSDLAVQHGDNGYLAEIRLPIHLELQAEAPQSAALHYEGKEGVA